VDLTPRLDLALPAGPLTLALVDVFSESGHEGALADAVEAALSEIAHLRVVRDGDTVVARTSLGHSARVVVAGHLDTVPAAGTARGWPAVTTRADGA
jgi:succinyl-diaminopimelate desuccinylase